MLCLTDRKQLREFLERHGIWARKGLAQHFLCSQSVVDAIVSRLDGFASALEIGPGPGVLTAQLSAKLEKVIALEIDARMASALKESAPNAEVRFGDALDEDLSGWAAELPKPRAIVSNMPYHITGPLLTKIAASRQYFAKAVLMMQKEVADRVLAMPGNSSRGSLSVFLQAQFEIRRVCAVPAGAFYPPPKVDSAVLELVNRPFEIAEESKDLFFEFVRSGFQQPRKTLANNLAGSLGRERALAAIEATGLTANVRPHMLALGHWTAIWAATGEAK